MWTGTSADLTFSDNDAVTVRVVPQWQDGPSSYVLDLACFPAQNAGDTTAQSVLIGSANFNEVTEPTPEPSPTETTTAEPTPEPSPTETATAEPTPEPSETREPSASPTTTVTTITPASRSQSATTPPTKPGLPSTGV